MEMIHGHVSLLVSFHAVIRVRSTSKQHVSKQSLTNSCLETALKEVVPDNDNGLMQLDIRFGWVAMNEAGGCIGQSIDQGR